MAPKQSPPPQSGGETLSSKKIFASEHGILPDTDLLSIQHGAREQQNIEMANVDGSSKSALKVRRQVIVNTAGTREDGDRNLRRDQKRGDRQREFPPFAYTVHDAREFRRLPMKWKVARSPVLLSVRCAAFGSNACAAANAAACRRRSSAVEKSWSAHSPRCSLPRTNRSRKAGP